MRKVSVRVIQLLALAAMTFAVAPPVRADEGSCMALCAMQDAYCHAKGGTLAGTCWYDHGSDICNLNGCDLPIND